jgi:hypothetical protein
MHQQLCKRLTSLCTSETFLALNKGKASTQPKCISLGTVQYGAPTNPKQNARTRCKQDATARVPQCTAPLTPRNQPKPAGQKRQPRNPWCDYRSDMAETTGEVKSELGFIVHYRW